MREERERSESEGVYVCVREREKGERESQEMVWWTLPADKLMPASDRKRFCDQTKTKTKKLVSAKFVKKCFIQTNLLEVKNLLAANSLLSTFLWDPFSIKVSAPPTKVPLEAVHSHNILIHIRSNNQFANSSKRTTQLY